MDELKITERRTGVLTPSEHLRRYTQEDLLAAGIRVSLSTLGPAGAFLAEFLTEFVPGQRADRLQDFAQEFRERMSGVEEQLKQRSAADAAYASLLEQATVAAVRTPSRTKRRDYARLLRYSLSQPETETTDHHALLQLLESLSASEVIILGRYGISAGGGHIGDTRVRDYEEAHATVFGGRKANLRSSPDDHRRWVMFGHYEDRLVSLGLLEEAEGIAKSGARSRRRLTPKGRLLLDVIDAGATHDNQPPA